MFGIALSAARVFVAMFVVMFVIMPVVKFVVMFVVVCNDCGDSYGDACCLHSHLRE